MNKVIIYTTPLCPFCEMAKEFFQEKKVTYQEKDVFSDSEARAEMVKKSNQLGVPVIEINGEIVIGFDRPRLEKLLKLRA